MAKNSIADWSATAEDNTDVGGISIAGTAPVSNFDGAVREIMAQVAETIGSGTEPSKIHVKGADIPSAATTNIGAATGDYVVVTGTTTITSFGSSTAGIERTLRFSGALTLTHNATSLILPGGANILTAAGDIAVFRSEGGSNWKCVSYQPYISKWEPIENAALGSVASYVRTGLADFRTLRISGVIRPLTASVTPILQTSINNGASWENGASDYFRQTITSSGTVPSSGGSTGNAAVIGPTDADSYVQFVTTIEDFNQNGFQALILTAFGAYRGATSGFTPGQVFSVRNSGTPRNALRILFSTGNISSGRIFLEGIRG